MLILFLRGFGIGLAIAAPVGPIGVLCIRRTLIKGRLTGFISGLGAATADAFYGSIAAFGLVYLSNFLIRVQVWLQVLGGTFLLYLGARAFLAKPAWVTTNSDGRGLLSAYLSTLFLTLTNPLTILSFTAVVAGQGISSGPGEYREAASLVAGIFTGSATWWLALSGLSNRLRKPFEGRGLIWVNRVFGVVIAGFGIVALVAGLSQGKAAHSNVISSIVPAQPEGFAYADGSLKLEFPRDHGAHPDFQTEWWYFTGNLVTSDNRKFGYQLTFFRRSLEPPGQWLDRPSHWATTQAYLAHFALTDVSSSEHRSFERLERGAAGLSGATTGPFRVWLDDWRVEEKGTNLYRLVAQDSATDSGQGLVAVDLTLADELGPVLQGMGGYSRKGFLPGNASYYYSLPRLQTRGTVKSGGMTFQVTGASWMDHEFSTSALSSNQVGWDWFSIQLDNHTELMVFQIRDSDGAVDPFSSGLWIAADGSTKALSRVDFDIKATGTWHSPKTGGLYPSKWTLTVPGIGLDVKIEPLVADQELDLMYKYWEGAVSIEGELGGTRVHGRGYVELTGYAGSMAGVF